MSHGLTNTRRAEFIDQGNCHGESRGQAATDSLAAYDRLSELAAILATGIHRLRAIQSALPECGQSPADSSSISLDQGRKFALMDAGLRPESEELDDVH